MGDVRSRDQAARCGPSWPGAAAASLIALVATCAPAAAAELKAAPCPPEADIQGPPEIVKPVAAILRGHGVATASGACGARVVKVSLASDAGAHGYQLHLVDGDGHASERQVADATTAASLIESWALDEDADLWAARPAAVPDASPAPAAVVASGGGAARPFKVQAGAMGQTVLTPDAVLWWGATASACTRISVLCLGLRADFARATSPLVIDRARGIWPDLTRTLIGLSISAAWPIAMGRWWIAPSLAVGGGWLHSLAEQGATSTSSDTLELGQAAVSTGLSITPRWSVTAGLSGTATRPWHEQDRQATTLYLPAPPRAFFTAGLGVWYAP